MLTSTTMYRISQSALRTLAARVEEIRAETEEYWHTEADPTRPEQEIDVTLDLVSYDLSADDRIVEPEARFPHDDLGDNPVRDVRDLLDVLSLPYEAVQVVDRAALAQHPMLANEDVERFLVVDGRTMRATWHTVGEEIPARV